MFVLLGMHLYLVIRHGISEPPEPGGRSIRRRTASATRSCCTRTACPFWPDAAWKDVVFALAVGAVVLVLAIVLGPPELGDAGRPDQSSRPTRGPTGTSSGTSRCWR